VIWLVKCSVFEHFLSIIWASTFVINQINANGKWLDLKAYEYQCMAPSSSNRSMPMESDLTNFSPVRWELGSGQFCHHWTSPFLSFWHLHLASSFSMPASKFSLGKSTNNHFWLRTIWAFLELAYSLYSVNNMQSIVTILLVCLSLNHILHVCQWWTMIPLASLVGFTGSIWKQSRNSLPAAQNSLWPPFSELFEAENWAPSRN